MSATLELRLDCPACGNAFERLWEQADGPIRCPGCGVRVCPCGCAGDLAGIRAGALYYSDACRKRVERTQNADTTRTGIRSGNVRSVQEAEALHETHKKEWTIRVLRRIKQALDTKGEYHADDCADLPVPAAHVNVIGSQVMRLRNLGIVVKIGERRNSSKASNSRWSGVYRYAKDGPPKLAKLVGPSSTALQGVGIAAVAGSGENPGAGSPAHESDHDAPPAKVATGSGSPDQLFDPGSLRAA